MLLHISAKFTQAGFNLGDGTTGYLFPYAGTADMAKLTTKSNIGQPGKWAFKVSGTQLEKPESSLPTPTDKVNLPTGGPTTKFSYNVTAVIHGFQGKQDVYVYTGGVIAIGG